MSGRSEPRISVELTPHTLANLPLGWLRCSGSAKFKVRCATVNQRSASMTKGSNTHFKRSARLVGQLAYAVFLISCVEAIAVPSGMVIGWGNYVNGQLNTPPIATNLVAVAAGTVYSLALRGDGTVVGWGDNTFGQSGVPRDLTNGMAIAASHLQSLAIRSNGLVVAWGSGAFGLTNVPAGLSSAVAVAAGGLPQLGLKERWHSRRVGKHQLRRARLAQKPLERSGNRCWTLSQLGA